MSEIVDDLLDDIRVDVDRIFRHSVLLGPEDVVYSGNYRRRVERLSAPDLCEFLTKISDFCMETFSNPLYYSDEIKELAIYLLIYYKEYDFLEKYVFSSTSTSDIDFMVFNTMYTALSVSDKNILLKYMPYLSYNSGYPFNFGLGTSVTFDDSEIQTLGAFGYTVDKHSNTIMRRED